MRRIGLVAIDGEGAFGSISASTAQDLVPARGDLRPAELPGPFGALLAELSALIGVVQEIDGCLDPQALRRFVFDAMIGPLPAGLGGKLDSELDACCKRARVCRHRDTTARL